MNPSRRLCLNAIGVGAMAAVAKWSMADDYPSRPIRLIVPAAPGGGSDTTARLLVEPLRESFKQPILVDNRPGAAGNIAAEAVAKAAPDGYTLLIGHSGIVGTNPHMYQKLPFDPLKDLLPVAPVLRSWAFLFVPAVSPIKTMKDLLERARAKPGALNYGSAGVGSVQHIGMELFNHTAGIQLTHVPYKGSAPMTAALLSGEIDVNLDFAVPAMNHVEAGKLRVLAVASPKRLAPYPNVPTVTEAGVKDFFIDVWVGLFTAPGTPKSIAERINREVGKATQSAAFKQYFQHRGAEELRGSQEDFSRLVQEEYVRGAKLVKLSGAKAE